MDIRGQLEFLGLNTGHQTCMTRVLIHHPFLFIENSLKKSFKTKGDPEGSSESWGCISQGLFWLLKTPRSREKNLWSCSLFSERSAFQHLKNNRRPQIEKNLLSNIKGSKYNRKHELNNQQSIRTLQRTHRAHRTEHRTHRTAHRTHKTTHKANRTAHRTVHRTTHRTHRTAQRTTNRNISCIGHISYTHLTLPTNSLV